MSERRLVPSGRLVGAALVAATPLLALVGLVPASAPLVTLVLAALSLLAIADAAMARGALAGVEVRAEPLLRLTQNRPAALSITVRSSSSAPLAVHLGLPWPDELGAERGEEALTLGPGQTAALRWALRPSRRGRFTVARCHLETGSALGLWQVRRALPLQAEVRVYPDLLLERAAAPALFLRRDAFGSFRSRRVGRGREFEQLREYQPGDAYGEVDWKATARRGKPIVRTFQVERTQEVYIVLDSSRCAARAVEESGGVLLDRMIRASLVLALAAQRGGDLFGLCTFSDRPDRFVAARRGQQHYLACREALAALEPSLKSPEFGEVASFLRLRLRRRALLVFLTDLSDPLLAEEFARALELLEGHHLVEVIDVLEPSSAELFSGPDPVDLDQVYQRLAGQLRHLGLRALGQTLARRGAHLSVVREEALAAEAVARYAAVKQRQAL